MIAELTRHPLFEQPRVERTELFCTKSKIRK